MQDSSYFWVRGRKKAATERAEFVCGGHGSDTFERGKEFENIQGGDGEWATKERKWRWQNDVYKLPGFQKKDQR